MTMQIIEHIAPLRAAIETLRGMKQGRSRASVGFVPTMGYLHAGHASLIRRAREENDIVVVSIFVNPLQFGPNEDYERYPRDAERDRQTAEEAGADIVFMPSVQEMYPAWPQAVKMTVGDIAGVLCGASRPGHFDGVATVVAKLFNIVQPDRAYFGLKDAQQVAVIQRMVLDFNMPVEIVPCPTVREDGGLALSSRNVYLSEEEKRQAVVLSEALDEAARHLDTDDAARLEARMRGRIGQVPLARIDYASVLAYPSLVPLDSDAPIWQALERTGDEQIIIALAVYFGRTRLIDNRIVSQSEVHSHV